MPGRYDGFIMRLILQLPVNCDIICSDNECLKDEDAGVEVIVMKYARNSENDVKSIEEQRENLSHYVRERKLAVDDTGEQFRAMMAKAGNGDTIYVTQKERISDNPESVLQSMDMMVKKNISLVEAGEYVESTELDEGLRR